MAQEGTPGGNGNRIGVDSDQSLMPIGMFSRAALLSVKALRAYHQQGILIPDSVDEETGYRSYHPGQLADAAILSRLRGLELPLAQVKEILVASDPEITRKILSQHQILMSERLTQTERIVDELQRAIVLPNEQTPVHVRTLEHEFALAVSGVMTSEEFSGFLGEAFGLLYEAANTLGFITSGPGAALYEPVIYDHDAERVIAYIPVMQPAPIPEPNRGLSVIELPRHQAAVIVHQGSHETIGQTYAALGSWVARNSPAAKGELIPGQTATDEEPSGPELMIREIYTVSLPDSDDPEAYRTEICWPI